MSPTILVFTFVFGCMLFIQPFINYRTLFFSRAIRTKFLHATFAARIRVLSLFQYQVNLSASYLAFEELLKLHHPMPFLESDSNSAEVSQYRSMSNNMLKTLYPQWDKEKCKIQPITLKSDNLEVLVYSIKDGDIADWKDPTQNFILYIHGGGFVSGDIDTYAGYECYLSKQNRMPVIHIEHRLSPESTIHSSINDVVDVYMSLLKFEPNIYRRMIGMGDSSGGLLWLRLIQIIIQKSLPVPQGLVLLSPWVDLSFTETKSDSNALEKRVFFSLHLALNLRQHLFHIDENLNQYEYYQEYQKQLREINPKEHSFKGFPPLYVSVGTEELFLCDAMMLEEFVLKNGGKIILDKGYGLMHNYPMYHMWSAEAKYTQNKIGTFIQEL